MYKATATIYVVSRNDSVLNFSDLQVGSELTSDYIKVFEMWEVHEKVISNLDLDYTYTDMASMLSVTNTSDTRMLDITVTNRIRKKQQRSQTSMRMWAQSISQKR